MIIDQNVYKLLEKWLQHSLKPMYATTTLVSLHLPFFSSQAEPSVLSTYIMALLRNDKPREELVSVCEEQLTDFIKAGTCFVILFC